MDLVPNTFPALCLAYGVVWTVLILYIVSLGKRLRTLEDIVRKRDGTQD